MFQNLCIRITAGAALMMGSALLLGCSADHRTPATSVVANAPITANDTPEVQPTAPAMKAFMDPVTGQMRDPTDAERAALERRNNAQAPQPRTMREQRLRKRGTAMTIEGDPQTPLQACTDAAGNVTFDHSCTSSQQPARDQERSSP